MRKKIIHSTFIVTVIANLSLLIFIPSCATSTSLPNAKKMTTVRQVFPFAVDIVETPFFASQGAHFSGRPDNVKISEIRGEAGLLGYCVESKVVSRSGPFRISVLLDKQLYVKQASVISYPWKRGRDVCKRVFTDQFKGKGPDAPLRLGKDIDAMTGATISSRVMTEGVRNTIKLLKVVKDKRFEEQTDKLTDPNQQNQQAEKLKTVKTLRNKKIKKGEILYRNYCSSCHALIEPARFSQKKWNMYVEKYGKKLTLEEKNLLLDYLNEYG